ncbi:ADP-ribosylation factor family-domain-containing protein [Mycena crocata]|nr:ADP-ribosylation factor family-domain-containing protein [Mycena crocata]
MGSALSKTSAAASGTVDYMFPARPKTFHILLLGLDDAGKTSLINRITQHELPAATLPTPTPTIAFEGRRVSYGSNHITLWEMGGQDKIRPLWRSSLLTAHAFMFVVDSASPERFPEAKEELHRLHTELRNQGYAHPLLVVASKMDSGTGQEVLAEVSRALDITGLAKWGRSMDLKGVSAKTNEGVNEAMQWFLENVSHAHISQHDEEKTRVLGAKHTRANEMATT